ncbi:TonB-dependent receptor [Candidatus Dependentiae bacterium]|nr:TonB-dependent receptor [Candidatus Dependentiae bacterium]
MKERFLWVVSLVFIFTFIVAVQAADDDFESEDAFFKVEEEIASVASKYAQKVSETPAIISVVSEEQIRNSGAKNLLEIVKLIPGVETFITQDGYPEISFRGIRGRANVLFQIDGHRLNSFYDGQSMYNFSVQGIKKVELIRGPGSSMHGTNAFVGVINIITKEYDGESELKFVSGDNSTNGITVFTGKKFSETNKFTVFAHSIKSDNSDLQLRSDARYNQKATNTEYPSPIDDKNEQNYLSFIYNLKKSKINFHYFDENRGAYIGTNSYADSNQFVKSRQMVIDYLLNEIKINDKSNISSKVYFDNGKYEKYTFAGFSDERDGPTGSRGYTKTDYKSMTIGTEMQLNWQPVESHKIVSGFQYEYMKLSDYEFLTNFAKPYDGKWVKDYLYGYGLGYPTSFTTDPRTGAVITGLGNWHGLTFPQNTDRKIFGLFLQDEWKIHSKFITTLGLRYDNYSDFGSTVNPKVAAVSPIIPDKFIIKASYATAFRAPTFQELYDRSQISVKNGSNGNVNLDPEKIKTFELGFEYRPHKSVKVKLNGFINEIEDNIFAQNVNKLWGASGPYDQYENINGIDIKGFESEIKYDYDKQNYSFFNYSWFEAVNKGGYIVGVDGNGPVRTSYESDMMEVPQKRYNLGVNVDGTLFGCLKNKKGRNYSLNAAYLYASERYINMLDLVSATGTSYSNSGGRRWKIDKYGVINLSLRTTESLSKDFSVQLSVYNLTDEDVYDNYYDTVNLNKTTIDWTSDKIFPVHGRFFNASVSVKF